MAAAGMIDPTKAGKYPIILSDALLGKPSKESYTAVRYNHKPALSSDSAPATARLKQSAKDSSFNLGFEDQGDKYQYNGARTSEDGKYVLIFDPARKAFILHRVDSTFHMNLTKTPTDSNVESLRKQFPHLEVKSTAKQAKGKGGAADKVGKATGARGKAGNTKQTASAKKKAENNKPVALALPDPSASKATPPPPPPAAAAPEKKLNRRARSPDSEEDEDDDDDGGLLIEYPGGPPDVKPVFQSSNNFSPGFPPTQRRFSEWERSAEQGDEDADADFEDDFGVEGEDEGDDEEGFKLPSPVNKNRNNRVPAEDHTIPVEEPMRFEFEDESDADAEGDVDVGDADADVDADALNELEAELMMEFENEKGNESEVSEEE
ncbi:RNA polymerase II transcription elongation factor-domain-containing protein [Apodospora peruviana]|uniref:RNA polymerase II transcription elongation factor-domain-containing protein n=1 Tax=Apodospora peruviana TaxID=516989 RepID=A0AAE0ITJ8_9PEZI|nr:RNA polymerase II transcription elongation factor-domain-containing protein [Apodospora peruviana]